MSEYEYENYEVGRTAIYHHLTKKEYRRCRVLEDMRAYREQVSQFPNEFRTGLVLDRMEYYYQKYGKHKWLPLQTAFPFNLRLVHFLLMVNPELDFSVGGALIKRIRDWGCPSSPMTKGFYNWCKQHERDPLFNMVSDIQPNFNRQSSVKRLYVVGKHLQENMVVKT